MRSRETIIRAALGLIEREGFAAVNVSSVAAAAGVSRQTVYSIFGSREEMVSQAVLTVAVELLEEVTAALDQTDSTSAYVVELIVGARREARRQPVLNALLQAERGNPLFDEGMMGRARPVAANLLAPLVARDSSLTDPDWFGAVVEIVTRLGLSVVLFDSEVTRTDTELHRFLSQWLEPGLRRGREQDLPSRSDPQT